MPRNTACEASKCQRLKIRAWREAPEKSGRGAPEKLLAARPKNLGLWRKILRDSLGASRYVRSNNRAPIQRV